MFYIMFIWLYFRSSVASHLFSFVCFEEDIGATELLASLPLELIIADKSSPCAAIRKLRNELQRGRPGAPK